MHKVVRVLRWQWAFLLIGAVILLGLVTQLSPTGYAVLQTDNTYNFAPPYDTFSGHNILSLTHTQIDNDTFHIDVDINDANSAIYHNLYYYSQTGWELVQLSPTNEWIRNSASLGIDESYANMVLRDNDEDFFIGVWVCDAIQNVWECGCKNPGDCGYWHVQSVELDFDGGTPQPCIDTDTDGYGVDVSELCLYGPLDCDDTDINVHPGATEVVYTGIDEDCNVSTPDNDIDLDSFLLVDDCDDNNPGINPLATEICENSIDEDCDSSDKTCNQCGEGGIPGIGCSCGGSAYWTGYCCDNAYQGSPCGTPEVIFYDGFESGTANTWEYLNPYSRVNGDEVQAGSYSLDLIYTPGGGTTRLNQYAQTSLVANDHLFYRYYLNFEGDFVQPINGIVVSQLGDEAIQFVRRWQGDDSQGKLFLQVNGVEYATSAILQNEQWYCVEEEVDVSGSLRMWVDDGLVLDQSGLSLGSTIDELIQGGLYSDSLGSSPIHVYIDNVVVSRMRVGC